LLPFELEASDDQAVASRKCSDGADEVASKISFAVSSGLLFPTSQSPQFKYIAEDLSRLAHGSNVVDATISDAMSAGQISLLEI
jgi:hypothetical protein